METSKDRVMAALSRYARAHKGTISQEGFCRASRLAKETVRRRFPSGWYSLLQAAGLADRVAQRRNIPEAELLAEYDRLHRLLGRRPSCSEITRHSRFSQGCFYLRFRGMKRLAEAYEAWKAGGGRGPEAAALRLCAAGAPEKGKPRGWRRGRVVSEHGWRTDGFPHGAPLSFRGLVHAPTTEAGVIHLFGLLGPELGFAIVGIRTGFPDCLALRPSKVDPDHWEPAFIEFEFRASNFIRHGHDHTKCDVIVCWENDWPDAPVPVIDLKSELRKIQAKAVA